MVQSPTGSGKTTQIPVILHEAGYSETGMIAVTQPRRIAAVSVSLFIARQLGTSFPGLVGYKMRFDDKTNTSTKIKIMTDGILLQEMKLDPYLSRYNVVMVDEAHERSLNIDFVLGLLKRVLAARSDFRVIVSSATMNAEVFSSYFAMPRMLPPGAKTPADLAGSRTAPTAAPFAGGAESGSPSALFADSGAETGETPALFAGEETGALVAAPIVNIETTVYPVTVIYDPPQVGAELQENPEGRKGMERRGRPGKGPGGEDRRLKNDRRDVPEKRVSPSLLAEEALNRQIALVIDRSLDNREKGAILCFLSGERSIKEAMRYISGEAFAKKLWMVPLYGRLSREAQELVFAPPPPGRRKLVLSTNIAETSVTIPDVTVVIDSGLAKLSYYNPHTFTSSLVESPVSRASIDQRKGRAGRTSAGTCYRLYQRKDYEGRPPYTTEEIYRTDLSEVVLRMSELGILDFDNFDFISSPGSEGIHSARDTLVLLGALNDDNTLSKTGEIMARFPLIPRHSRIIVEAILRYPEVMEEVLIATAFLSAQSPYILPAGEEDTAREAHRRFREKNGDFASYVTVFRSFMEVRGGGSASSQNGGDEGGASALRWCEENYLDARVMGEIVNIKEQLEQIVSDLGIPISAAGDISRGDKMDAYLCCIASGMIQFVCVRDGRDYRSLTAEHISIHPGSTLFRETPQYMVAGEIVRTSRMYAMSVSPLDKKLLERIDPGLEKHLRQLVIGNSRSSAGESRDAGERDGGKKGLDKKKEKGYTKKHEYTHQRKRRGRRG